MGRRAESLRDELHAVFRRVKVVPTNPTVAMEILRLADDPTSSAEQFAKVIQADAALAARLLALANTAHYAQREPVTTIKRAVTLMGLRRIRMAALGFQLVAHLDRLGGAAFDLESFWQHSVLRACLAREIASRVVPTHAEEAFVVGLLQDCGILLLVQVLGDEYADLHASQSLSPTAFQVEETKRFRFDHVEAIRVLAAEWKLPEVIAVPLGGHHERVDLGPEATETKRLWAVSYFVGSLPLVGDQTPAPSEPALMAYAEAQLGLDEQAVQRCLEHAGTSYRQVAPLLAEQLPKDLDVAELLDQANEHLSRAAAEAVSRAEAVEADRDRIRRQQAQLESALGQYRERAARDPLTRLLNRGALVDATLACVRECHDRNLSLAVLFLDIDDFKVVNDRFGHHVGDEVLRVLAVAVSESVINGGFAGRYGGEEFIIVVPAIEEEDARQRARRLVDRVRNASLGEGSSPGSVTCSVGAVWGRPAPGSSPQDLFAAADELMYQAKQRGKDRCCFKSLARPDEIAELAAGAAAQETALAVDPAQEAPADVTQEDMRRLAMELNQTEPRRFTSMRKRERQDMLVECRVYCFVSGAPAVRSYPGCVRNLSTGGAGVLTTRPMIRGEPVEVEIELSEGVGGIHLAGLVAFCRHIRDGIYEVGIQLVTQGGKPVLCRDGTSTDEQLDWVIEALEASHGQGWQYRESA